MSTSHARQPRAGGATATKARTARPEKRASSETPRPAPQQVLAAFTAPIEPVKVGPLYQLGLLVAALAMLLLPAIYLALVVATAYGLYRYAINGAAIFEGRGNARGKVLVYLAPLVIGGILLLFTVKPLFARRQRRDNPLSLARHEEPLLFEFVDRLCEVVRAPRPSRIDVDTEANASASFDRGLTGLLTQRLVLTIGLPLAAGLSLRQLTGVLAHEFGHFAQGSGMRLSYIVRMTNLWFARVVYDRDRWDQWLVETSRQSPHWGITLVAALARFFVWLTRWVLWGLMMAGHAISSMLSRQMEFDADRYECRVAGSDDFATTSERIQMLSVASGAAFNDLNDAWRERRLCDDLPALIRWREADMPADVRGAVRKHSDEAKTGWLDTHPATSERIASARREAAPGVFRLDAPATALFRDFEGLSRRATAAFYFEAIGPQVTPGNLVPTASLVAARGKRREDYNAMERFFAGLIDATRPVFAGRIRDPPSADRRGDVAERLLELRTTLVADAPAAREIAKRWDQADERVLAASRIREQRTAGVAGRVAAKDFGLPENTPVDPESLTAFERANRAERDASRTKVDAALGVAMERLRLALALERVADAKPAAASPASDNSGDDDFGAYDLKEATPEEARDDRMLSALSAIEACRVDTEMLRQQFILLAAVLSKVSDKNPQSLVETVLFHSRKCADLLRSVHQSLRTATYPYEHAEGRVSISQFASRILPPAEEPGHVFEASKATLEAIYGLYVRLLSDLASRAERVEAELGLPPMSAAAAADPPSDSQCAE